MSRAARERGCQGPPRAVVERRPVPIEKDSGGRKLTDSARKIWFTARSATAEPQSLQPEAHLTQIFKSLIYMVRREGEGRRADRVNPHSSLCSHSSLVTR